jgi:hypothetical protein
MKEEFSKDIEILKKSRLSLEMKSLINQIKNSDESFTNRWNQVKDRISELKPFGEGKKRRLISCHQVTHL